MRLKRVFRVNFEVKIWGGSVGIHEAAPLPCIITIFVII